MKSKALNLTDQEMIEKLKLCFEEFLELGCEGDIDQFEFQEICEKYKLLKKFKASGDEDADYYLFPVWFGDQDVRNHMGIEWDQPTPEEIEDEIKG